jgi:predicted permease
MGNLIADVRYGWRMLAKTPGLTAVVAVTLALGIGANALIFSIVNGFLLRPLPVPHPGEIAALAARPKADITLAYSFSYPEFLDFRKQAGAFAELFGYSTGLRGVSSDNRADQVLAAFVTGNYFSALGVKPALGRLIRPGEEDQPGIEPVVVLDYSYWQNRFAGNPAAIGKQIRVNGQSATIIGVAPKGFSGTQSLVEMGIYMPFSSRSLFGAGAGNSLQDRGARFITVLARLKSGVSFAQAQTSMDVIAARLSKQYPSTDGNVSVRVYREWLARPFPIGNSIVPMIAGFFLILAVLLLLVACMNIANVLLARATVRQREMGLRAALGAVRARLIRQMLTETILLGLSGGVLGIVLGEWANPGDISKMAGGSLPLHLDYSFDWHVFAYCFAAALFTGVFVGLWPALRASRADLNSVLQESGRSGTAGVSRHRLRSALVIVQVAGSLVLLVVAGLFVRSLQHAETMYLGFDPDHLLNVTLAPNEIGYDAIQTKDFYRELTARTRALPGVESVSLAYAVPLGGLNAAYVAPVTIEGQPLARDQQPLRLFFNNVDSSYFKTMRVPLLRGRAFTDLDNEKAPGVAVVNRYMADKFWPHQDPLGKRFTFTAPNGAAKTVEIVGVAGNGKYIFISEGANPFFYVPLAQNYISMRVLQVRSSVAPQTLLRPVEREIHNLAPDLPIVDGRTMQESIAGYNGLWIFRAGAQLASGIGAIGLILAVVGLYGIVSFTAAERAREIGIRMALGGSAGDVMGLILRQGVRMVLIGLAIGLAAALGITRVMTQLLIGVRPNDPMTYAAVALLLAMIALAACWIPARRATRVDPGVALRYE